MDDTEIKVGDWVRLCVGTLHGQVIGTQVVGGNRTLYRVHIPMAPRDMSGNFPAETLIKVPPGIPYDQTAEAAGVDLTLDSQGILDSFDFDRAFYEQSVLESLHTEPTIDDRPELKLGDWVRDRYSKLHGRVVESRFSNGAGGRTVYRVWIPMTPLPLFGHYAADDLEKVPPGIPFEQTPEAAGDDMKLDPVDILASYGFE